MEKNMHCGPIHRLPEDLWLTGLIVPDKETGLYTFYWANLIPNLQQFKEKLMELGMKEEEIIPFEGIKKKLISIVKPLNDVIRAKQNGLPDCQSPSPGEILCSTAA
jgi:hypothetical protein